MRGGVRSAVTALVMRAARPSQDQLQTTAAARTRIRPMSTQPPLPPGNESAPAWSLRGVTEKAGHFFAIGTAASVVVVGGLGISTWLMMGASGVQESWGRAEDNKCKLAEAQAVLAERREALGEEDVLTANAHYNVAFELRWVAARRWLDKSGFAEAAEHFNTAAAIFSKVHGEGHKETQDARVQAEAARRGELHPYAVSPEYSAPRPMKSFYQMWKDEQAEAGKT
mmetsp:Transcript_72205/g.145270  ORF Transcript_72205/g.145270 Transcript_72205/m.145270 type:complete len:226 (+) Transcript_72205:144-821(+)